MPVDTPNPAPTTPVIIVPKGGSYTGEGSGGGKGGTYVDASGKIISAGSGSTVGSSSTGSGYKGGGTTTTTPPPQTYQQLSLDQKIEYTRSLAQKQIGTVTRYSVNPQTGEITWYGASAFVGGEGLKGGERKVTYGKDLVYSGADKYGGIPSKETAVIVKDGNKTIVYDTPEAFQFQTQKELNKEFARRYTETRLKQFENMISKNIPFNPNELNEYISIIRPDIQTELLKKTGTRSTKDIVTGEVTFKKGEKITTLYPSGAEVSTISKTALFNEQFFKNIPKKEIILTELKEKSPIYEKILETNQPRKEASDWENRLSGFLSLPKSLALGIKETLFYIPESYGTYQKLLYPTTSKKASLELTYNQKRLFESENVQTLGVMGGLGVVSFFNPFAGFTIGAGMIGESIQTYQATPKNTAESKFQEGQFVFLAATPFLLKGTELFRSKTQKGINLPKGTTESIISPLEVTKVSEIIVEKPVNKLFLSIKGTEPIVNYIKDKTLQLKLDTLSGLMEVKKLNKEITQPFYNILQEVRIKSQPVIELTKTKIKQLGFDTQIGFESVLMLNKEIAQPFKYLTQGIIESGRKDFIQLKYYSEVAKINLEYAAKRSINAININTFQQQQFLSKQVFKPIKLFTELKIESFKELPKQTKELIFDIGKETKIKLGEYKQGFFELGINVENVLKETSQPIFKKYIETKFLLSDVTQEAKGKVTQFGKDFLDITTPSIIEFKYAAQKLNINTEYIAKGLFNEAKLITGYGKNLLLDLGYESKLKLNQFKQDFLDITRPSLIELKYLGEKSKINLEYIGKRGINRLKLELGNEFPIDLLFKDIKSKELTLRTILYKYSPFELKTKTELIPTKIQLIEYMPTKGTLFYKMENPSTGELNYFADIIQKQKIKIGKELYEIVTTEKKQAQPIKDLNIVIDYPDMGTIFEKDNLFKIDSEFSSKIIYKNKVIELKGISEGLQQIKDKTFKGLEVINVEGKSTINKYIGNIAGKKSQIINITTLSKIDGKNIKLSFFKEVILNKRMIEQQVPKEFTTSTVKGIKINDIDKFTKDFRSWETESKIKQKGVLEEVLGESKGITKQITKIKLDKPVMTENLDIVKEKTINKLINEVKLENLNKPELKLSKRDIFGGDVIFKKGVSLFPKYTQLTEEEIYKGSKGKDFFKEKIETSFKYNIGTPSGGKLREEQENLGNLKIKTEPSLSMKEENKSKIEYISITDVTQDITPKIKITTKAINIPKTKQKTDFMFDININTDIDIVTEPLPQLDSFQFNKEPTPKPKKKILGFDVYIKRKQLKLGKGKYAPTGFEKINIKALTEAGAKVFGIEALSKSAARTIVLKPSKEEGISYKDYELPSLKERVTPSKSILGGLVQKAKYAISSVQEKAEIPYQAQRERRAKKAFKFKL